MVVYGLSSMYVDTSVGVSTCMCVCAGVYVQGSLNKFPDFFRMGTFIDSTYMKV